MESKPTSILLAGVVALVLSYSTAAVAQESQNCLHPQMAITPTGGV